jgi:hypothetical protein
LLRARFFDCINLFVVLEEKMKKWCSPGLALIALLALFASTLPAYAWFCPMTGRVGSSAFVCAGMTQNCAHTPSKCCHSIELPQSSSVVNTQVSSAPFAVFSKSPTLVTKVDYSTWNVPQLNILRAIGQGKIPRPPADESARSIPSFYLCTQHGTPPFLGRAPPAV